MSFQSDAKHSQIRTFVAVPLPEPALTELECYLNSLKKRARLRWVRAAQLHITLRFLGEQPLEIIEKVRNALRHLPVTPFEIELSYAGAFPNLKSPRVLWLAGKRGMHELTALAESVNTSLDTIGLPRERRAFKPHLTLARTDGSPLPSQLLSELQKAPTLIWCCKSFDLMRSKLTPQGAVYAKIPLS